MNTLLDSLKDIQESGASLVQFGRSLQKNGFAVKPTRINMVLRKMADRDSRPIEGIDLKELFSRVKQAVKRHSNRNQFTHREIRAFPALLSMAGDDVDIIEFLLRHLDFTRMSVFKRTAFVYFDIYSKNRAVDMLRNKLRSALKQDATLAYGVPYLEKYKFLLDFNGLDELAEYFRNGIISFFKKNPNFPVSFPWTRFTKEAIVDAFRQNIRNADVVMELFREIIYTERYREKIPFVAGFVISAVDKSNNQSYRNTVIYELNKYMGDPRDPSKGYMWSHVGEKEIQIYTYWRKKTDLDLFFEIISKTTRGDVEADKMWRYRKAFWEKYLDDMKYTRVILGPEAERIANRLYSNKVTSYARLERCTSLQSLFLFSIGDYVFLEVSHNGALRAYKMGKAPIPFFEKDSRRGVYAYNEIIHYPAMERWVHSHSEGGTWQGNVRRWIYNRCGISRIR